MEALNTLKKQMETLARHHTEYFYKLIWTDQSVKYSEESRLDLKPLNYGNIEKRLKKVWNENNLKNINQVLFNNSLKNLIRARDGIITAILKDVKKDISDEVFGTYVPQVYELLTELFQSTSCSEKNLYFHTLIDYYYLSLSNNLQRKMKLDIAHLLPLVLFEKQINIFLPIAKLDNMNSICNDIETTEQTKLKLLKPVILEMYEYFKYPNFLREDCLKILEDHVGPYNFKLVKYHLITVEEREHVSKLTITYIQENSNETLNLMVKHFSADNKLCGFAKEEYIYGVFLPKLKKFGLNSVLDFAPTCYILRNNDVIVLENPLTEKIVDDYSLDLAARVINQLAKLHACSFAVEKLNTHLEEEFAVYLQETAAEVVETNMKIVIDYILDKFPYIYQDRNLTIDNFKAKLKSILEKTYKNLQKSTVYSNVICHGNLRHYNVIFQENSNKNLDLCLLTNYESSRYCPPVIDLLYFFYANTTRKFRSKYMSSLIREYYEYLSNSLQKCKICIDQLYSFGSFLETCTYFKSTAICSALCPMELLVVNKLHASPHIIEEVFQRNKINQDAIKELIDELYDICEKHN